jgi:hypothetical protein
LTDWFSPHVSGTHGSVHTGRGDQVNYFISVADSKGRTPRKQAADDLLWLAQRFVHPAGFGRARDVLESHRTVFLDAPQGSGRITTAKMLLWELRPDAENLQELLPQEREGGFWLDLAHIGDGDRAWLDLSEAGGSLWTDVHAELSSLRAVVHERDARLVVVLPNEPKDPLPESDQYRVRIERPPAQEVLRRHLRLAGIPQPGQLPAGQFPGDNQPLREIARYVRLITEARERASGQGDLATWCAAGYQAWRGQETQVAALMARLRQGPQRALLLATAMLHGAHADSVHGAAASFLRTVEHPRDESPVLERATLGHQLDEINAELDASGNVRFTTFDYDSAVRTYFWTHLPELHEHMRDWVGRIAGSAILTDAEREALVRRFTELCLAHRYQSTWVSLVKQCTAKRTPGGMKAAALVLQRGVQDEAHGRIFRRQIYQWSRLDYLPDLLAEVITAACRDEMVVSHPDEALVRLHHVARRERGTCAREALVGLVNGDRRLFRQMLNRLTDTSPERTKWPVDADLFLELADPAALTEADPRNHTLMDDSDILRQLAKGWDLAFANSSYETWQPLAARWLIRAAEDGTHRHALLDVLVGGGGPRTSVLARLYAMTRRPELRPTVSGLLLEKINVAQGVQFA